MGSTRSRRKSCCATERGPEGPLASRSLLGIVGTQQRINKQGAEKETRKAVLEARGFNRAPLHPRHGEVQQITDLSEVRLLFFRSAAARAAAPELPIFSPKRLQRVSPRVEREQG